VHEGVTLVVDTGKAFEQIETGVKDISAVVEQISRSAEDEATGLQQINSPMGQLDQVTQQNAAMSEEASAASVSLAEQGERLAHLIGQFRIEASSDNAIARELKKAAPHAFREPCGPAPDVGRRAPPWAPPLSARPRRIAATAAARGSSRAPAKEHEDRDWTEF
jgi:methyl-accepting chemotaxis protein